MGELDVPIFEEPKLRGDARVAQSQLDQKNAQLSDLGGQVSADVRDSILDIQAAQQLVEVARSNVQLAREAFSEAQQRYEAGVSDNLAVSQAQQAMAQADDQYVSSLYQHNIAKLSLARALGVAQTRITSNTWEESDVADQNTEQKTRNRTEEPPEIGHGGIRGGASSLSARSPILVVGALLFWWHSTYYEDTDDARINGHLIQISSRIAGHVIKSRCRREPVRRRRVNLAEIDQNDFETALNQAEANLEAAEASYEAARSMYR